MASAWTDGPQQHRTSQPRRMKTLELVLDDEDPEVQTASGLDSTKSLVAADSPDATGAVKPLQKAAGGPECEVATPEYIADLIREFFRVHQITAALDAFETERPEGRRNAEAIDALDRQLLASDGAVFRAEPGISRLEAFVQSWNQVEHAIELLAPAKESKPKKAKKKMLTIEATTAAVPEVNDTPTPSTEWDLGVPGCTPKPRAQDLKSFGFDDVDDLTSSCPAPTDAPLPSPVLDKFKARATGKKVSIGEDGSTPKKEYIFYRETPPSFVTESEEAAREVMEKLSQDPKYDIVPPEAQQRFVELSSSDVGKYAIGKRVEGLGATRSISGVISKKYGSKQCGMSGPGTIVIDTQPDADAGSSTTSPPSSTTFSADDEALIDSLLETS